MRSGNDGFDHDRGHGHGGGGDSSPAAAGGEGAGRPAEAAGPAAAGDDTGDGDDRAGDGGDGDERAGDGGDGGGDVGAGKLARLIEAVGIAERHVAEAVVLAGEVADAGVAERVEGQSLEVVLATACRLTGADRKTLITAGQVLADMPCLRGLFVAGEVAWGVVRLATLETRRLSRADRQAIDGRLAATVAERGSIGAFEPDELGPRRSGRPPTTSAMPLRSSATSATGWPIVFWRSSGICLAGRGGMASWMRP